MAPRHPIPVGARKGAFDRLCRNAKECWSSVWIALWFAVASDFEFPSRCWPHNDTTDAKTAEQKTARPPSSLKSDYDFGRMTASITWMTPLEVVMSALTTFAPSTLTPLVASMEIFWPCTEAA